MSDQENDTRPTDFSPEGQIEEDEKLTEKKRRELLTPDQLAKEDSEADISDDTEEADRVCFNCGSEQGFNIADAMTGTLVCKSCNSVIEPAEEWIPPRDTYGILPE